MLTQLIHKIVGSSVAPIKQAQTESVDFVFLFFGTFLNDGLVYPTVKEFGSGVKHLTCIKLKEFIPLFIMAVTY